VILIDLDDLTSHPTGNLPQFPFLVLGGLFPGADAEIQGGFTMTVGAHDAFRPIAAVLRTASASI